MSLLILTDLLKDRAHSQRRVPVNYFSIIFISFHICTVHLAIIKVFFYYQLMHKRIFFLKYQNLH